MNGKFCPGCEKTRRLSKWRKNKRKKDGLQSYCKDCQKIKDREWRDRHRDTFRRKIRRFAANNREYMKRHNLAWRENNPNYRYYRDPVKIKAGRLLQQAVKAGRMIRPDYCSECLQYGPVHAHHADYSKPFKVEWLCPECHGKRHRMVA